MSEASWLEKFFGLDTVCCDCRKDKDGVPSAAGSRFSNPMRCGLGITFREDFGGKLHVHGLLPDGAGDRCGAVQVGDVLIAVDGINVEGMRQEHISSLCLGLEGTEVVATFQRPPQMTEYKVTLVRCRTPAPTAGGTISPE